MYLPFNVALELARWWPRVEIDGPCVRVMCSLARRIVIVDCETRRVLLAGDGLDDQVIPLAPGWYEQADAHLDGDGWPFAGVDWHSTPG